MMVTADHPMRKIRPLIDTARIRQLCEPLYAETGRPSIPPEQLFLALLGGYLLGVTSERALVRELTGNHHDSGPPNEGFSYHNCDERRRGFVNTLLDSSLSFVTHVPSQSCRRPARNRMHPVRL